MTALVYRPIYGHKFGVHRERNALSGSDKYICFLQELLFISFSPSRSFSSTTLLRRKVNIGKSLATNNEIKIAVRSFGFLTALIRRFRQMGTGCSHLTKSPDESGEKAERLRGSTLPGAL